MRTIALIVSALALVLIVAWLRGDPEPASMHRSADSMDIEPHRERSQ